MVALDDYRRSDAVSPLTLWQMIQISPFILFLPFAVVFGVFRENKGRSWRRAARTAAARYILSVRVWTAWELKSVVGLTTAQTYEAWARTNGAEVLTNELPEGAKLHWIGPRRVDRVILYFSGGGYVLPPREEHFDMLLALQQEFKGAVGFALLNYALVPENPFPKQLRQAFAAVQHLLDAGTCPSKLILAGDSAGGNLALQIVAQLLDPHPSLPTPPAGPQLCLGGLLLLSPWMEFGTDAPSHTRNEARDALPLCTYRLFVDCVMPGVSPDIRAHLEPAFATACGRWRGMDRVVRRVLVIAGEYEGLLDTIEETAHAIAEEVQDTTVFVLPEGVHDDLIQAFGAGEGPEGEDYKLIVSWVAKTLEL